MKLTPEQIQGILERASVAYLPAPAGVSFTGLIEKELSELDIPEPTPMWIHGSERLPTKDDAGYGGGVYVFWIDGDGDKRVATWDWEDVHQSMWWTTAPKHLKAPDPFDQWFQTIKPVGNLGEKELLKMAYELGQQNPK